MTLLTMIEYCRSSISPRAKLASRPRLMAWPFSSKYVALLIRGVYTHDDVLFVSKEMLTCGCSGSGRLVATYFENLLPREGNADYYKRTRMPICLTAIEDKLNKGDFKNLSELESYFKRMIANAKEFYPRSSAVFDDAERVRKALSNYMTKTNPAYQTRGYQAVPTPLPPEDGEEVEEEEEADEDAEGEEQEAEEQPAEEDNAEDDEEEEEDDEEEEEDEEEDEEPASRRRSIIIKRSRGRPSRNSTSQTNTPRRNRASGRSDREYHNVPFKGLSFQQAQEKMVEDLLRYKEPEYAFLRWQIQWHRIANHAIGTRDTLSRLLICHPAR